MRSRRAATNALAYGFGGKLAFCRMLPQNLTRNSWRGEKMASFIQARRMMVDGQIRTNDVTDHALLAAMLETPRERFVPPDKSALAYLDSNIVVSDPSAGAPPRCLLRPMVLAKLIQAAGIAASDRVLDVGGATGYGAGILARLAAEVTLLEEHRALAGRATGALAELGLANVTVVTGPLAAGWPARAPYDAIVLEGCTEIAPQALFAQLNEGGRLVCIQGVGPAAKGMVYRFVAGDVSGRPIFDAAAPLLPGFAAAPAFVF
jgi:protein-L-isoaspartate(D-aspartate) O-methyltransferase